MSCSFSVTEVRNALRCPRVFTIGRRSGQQISFPLGASSLGSAFHHLAEVFARGVADPPARVRDLGPGAAPEEVGFALSSWLLELLVRELELNPAYGSMPAEIDDLAEALRELSRYLASRITRTGGRPADVLAQFITSAELPAETPVELGDVSVRLSGRIDALHAPPRGDVEVVEYKLTDEENDELDRAQVALYRYLLKRSRGLDASPVILRFNPRLTVTRLPPEAADLVVEQRFLPLIRSMVRWLERPETAGPPTRTDLCAACPVRRTCREMYPKALPSRDDPPAGALRPRPEPSGGVAASTVEVAHAHRPDPLAREPDEEGVREAERLKRRILEILSAQGVSAAVPKEPLVGARLIRVEVSAPRGRVGAIDRAAEDVRHQLHAEDDILADYARDGGRRVFSVGRRRPRTVHLAPLLERGAELLSERPGRFVLGEGLDGGPVFGDLSDPTSCHLLVGGTTGSGKSVLLRGIAAGLAHYHPPSALRFYLVDPKRVSFQPLASGLSAHLAAPLCFDVEQALRVLEDLVEEMEDRYRLFEEERVQDLDELNGSKPPSERLARNVVIIDEFQDLLGEKSTREPFVSAIRRLGAKARAAGIHLILATQRPTKENVPTSIKANLPGRIALRTASAMESRIILDRGGAEALLGNGDLLADLGRGVVRAQSARA